MWGGDEGRVGVCGYVFDDGLVGVCVCVMVGV